MAQALSSSRPQIPGAGTTGHDTPPGESFTALQRWLNWQCGMIDGVIRASLYTVKQGAGQVYAGTGQAHWPGPHPDPARLLAHANAALAKRACVVHAMPAVPGNKLKIECVSIPLPAASPRFVLSLLIAPRQAVRHADLAKLVQWGAHWLQDAEANTACRLHRPTGQVLDGQEVLASCAASQSLLAAISELVTVLAEALACERVSLGLLGKRRVQLRTISGIARFDHRMRLVRNIEQAMDEALDQAAVVASATSVKSAMRRTAPLNQHHRYLAKGQSGYCTSVPLSDAQGQFGAITLERSEATPFDEQETAWVEKLAGLVTPVLRLHSEKEKGSVARLQASTRQAFSRFYCEPLGFRPTVKTVLAVCAVVTIILSILVKGEYRITSSVTIEGADKQVVVAPYPGYIRSSTTRAGEQVEEGQVLASLDTSALQVEKEKWLSELRKVEKSYAQFLAASDRVEMSLAAALQQELTAELQLVDQRIQRSQVKAPYRGVVVSGDLNQLLGAPVEQGQVLFEIASMDRFRLMLDIDEQAIADVSPGQAATVRLASTPGVSHAAMLKSVQPVAVMAAGKNVFRAEAELQDANATLRPGMHGIAKISAGQRSWLWLSTHKLVRRLRIWLWSAGF